jgi:hypothetical protein
MTTVDVFLDETEEWKTDFTKFEVKQSQPLVFKDDPVALAWASYRRWEDHGSRWSELEIMTPTEEDYARSTEIRKYYADRILLSMLSGKQISEFRKKLYGVVTNAGTLEKKDIGLLYRLPYFYMEDLALDRVVEQTEPVNNRHPAQEIVTEFTVIEQVYRSRAGGDYIQFWMRGEGYKQAFMMTAKIDNPYYKPVKLSGTAITKFHNGHHRGVGFYYLANIETI